MRIDIRRTGSIKSGDDVIGNTTRIKVVKNKVAAPFRTAEVELLFGKGFNRTGEILDLGVAAGLIDKSGAWYSYRGERIGQGRDKSCDWLREHPEMADSIEKEIRDRKVQMPLVADETA